MITCTNPLEIMLMPFSIKYFIFIIFLKTVINHMLVYFSLQRTTNSSHCDMCAFVYVCVYMYICHCDITELYTNKSENLRKTV